MDPQTLNIYICIYIYLYKYIFIHIWTLQLLDLIVPLGRFGENILASVFDLRLKKQLLQIKVPNINLSLFTALMLSNLIIVGKKTSTI